MSFIFPSTVKLEKQWQRKSSSLSVSHCWAFKLNWLIKTYWPAVQVRKAGAPEHQESEKKGKSRRWRHLSRPWLPGMQEQELDRGGGYTSCRTQTRKEKKTQSFEVNEKLNSPLTRDSDASSFIALASRQSSHNDGIFFFSAIILVIMISRFQLKEGSPKAGPLSCGLKTSVLTKYFTTWSESSMGPLG